MADGYRVLRVIEYTYENAEVAEQDMLRWTHGMANARMQMRSATLQFDTIKWRTDPTQEERNKLLARAEMLLAYIGEPYLEPPYPNEEIGKWLADAQKLADK